MSAGASAIPILAQLPRRLEPEWLDELPGDDPRAVRSRRDLRLMNRIMSHAGVIRRALVLPLADRVETARLRIAELGAGDGTLMLRVLHSSSFDAADVVLVDRQPVVSTATIDRYRAAGHRLEVCGDDVYAFLSEAGGRYDAIVANLFLHHFDGPQLQRLMTLAAERTRLFIGCEPRRARVPLWGSHLLGLIGCNDVTRHDAVVSVRAGFAGSELSELWPRAAGDWQLSEQPAALFSHLFIARSIK